jgi:hypothetical protein
MYVIPNQGTKWYLGLGIVLSQRDYCLENRET